MQVVWTDDAAGSTPAASDQLVIDESFGYVINAAAKAFARALADSLADHEISVAQWAVLLILWADDGLSQTELSRRVAIEDATMVRTLDRMERDDLVRRERDPRDRRRHTIVLTERGRSLRDVLVPRAMAVNAAATRTFSADERRQLVDLLRRMIAALEGAAETPPVIDQR